MIIPIAEQWVNQQFEKQRITTNGNDDVYCSRQGIIEACQIFAKLHVEAALKEASIKAKQIEDPYDYTGNTGSEYPADYIIDKNSILNAYPLENIK